MKIIAFLLLIATARATPTVLTVTSQERARIVSDWNRCNPSGRTYNHNFDSMRPLLNPGDKIITEAYVGQKCKGEVLLMNNPKLRTDMPVAHLCCDETATHVYMTGINNRRSEGWVTKSAIIFVAVAVLKSP